jgi:hypothetical protein
VDTSFLLSLLSVALPALVVALVGVILALINLRRVPTVAFLALLGFGFMLLTSVASILARAVFWQQLREGEIAHERFAHLMSVIGIASGLGHALALTLVVIAVFIGRGPKTPARAERKPDEEG